jgi:hypothetical protein
MFSLKAINGLVVLVLVFTTNGFAQENRQSYELPPVNYAPVSPWPPHMFETYHHDSTAAGNYLRGLSSVNYARGNYWLSISQARILFEHARSLNYCNRQNWIELRAWNRARIGAEKSQRATDARAKNDGGRLARYEAAYRLSNAELDRNTGEIAWPNSLQSAEYADVRFEIENLLRELTLDAGTFDVNAKALSQSVTHFSRHLNKNRGNVQRDDYVAAQKFLRGLKYEPEFVKPANVVISATFSQSSKSRID